MNSSGSSAKAKTRYKKIYRSARLPVGLPERNGGAVPGLQGLRRRRRPLRRRPRVGTRRHLSARLRSPVSARRPRAGERRGVEARLAWAPRTDALTNGRPRTENPRGGTRRHRSWRHLSSRWLPPLVSRDPIHVSARYGDDERVGRTLKEPEEGSLEQTYAGRQSAGCSERRHRSATSDGKKMMI